MVALHQWHHSHFGWLEITVHCALHQRDIKSIPGLGPHQPCCKEARLVFLSPKHSSKSSLWSHHQNRTEKYQLQPVDGWADPWALRNILGAFLGHWSQQQRWTRAPGHDEKVWWWYNALQWLHLVIVFWPNSSEAFAAPEVIDCYMIAFVPESQYLSILINIWTWTAIFINIYWYLSILINIWTWMEIFIKSMFTLHQHSTTLFALFYHLRCTCSTE